MLDALEPAATFLGALLVAFTFHDLISTTVSVASGAGPLTGRLSSGIWRASLWLCRRLAIPGALRRAGPLILFTVISVWTVLLILGWALVFGQPETIVTVSDGKPTAFLGNVYFASATVTGIGSPGLATSQDGWQLVEQLAAASGVALLGLSIAYVVPIVQAVVTKREIAAYVHTLGDDANEIVRRAWNGDDLGELDLHLISLTAQLAGLTERYLAYPIVHYFHSGDRRTAIGPAVAALDGVLTLNEHVLAREIRLDESVTLPLERAVTTFLDTVSPSRPPVEPVEASWPPFDDLDNAGIPLVDGTPVEPMPPAVKHRQEQVLAYLVHDGWATSDIREHAA